MTDLSTPETTHAASSAAAWLARGQAALRAADWAGARSAFEQSLQLAETPEAHDGLGLALWWLNAIEAAHEQRTLAYRGYREGGAIGRAARIACWLAREQIFLSANFLAMQGWFARAEHLVEALPPGPERAWCIILRASLLASPDEMITTARSVIEAARAAADASLEAFALAFCGQALVAVGRVGEGMACLDEAMTMTTGGEIADFNVTSEVFCVMLSACEAAGDLTRSALWCERATAFAQRYDCPFLSAYCRTAYGGLMTALGRWHEAETALTEAIQAFERGHRGLRRHAVIKLADLRLSQGKLDEAEVLLRGMEDQEAAALALARLALLRGDAPQARALLERVLPLAPDAPAGLMHVPALLLLIDVLLAAGDHEAAGGRLADLATIAENAHSPLLTAQVEFTRGRTLLHAGDYAGARRRFLSVLDGLRAYEQSLLAGQARLRMAQIMRDTDLPGAIAWARGALATFERLGAEHDAAEAAGLLRDLGAPRGTGPRRQAPLTPRETEIAALIATGLTNRDIADRLVISAKTVEHHVSSILGKLELRNRSEIAALAATGQIPNAARGS